MTLSMIKLYFRSIFSTHLLMSPLRITSIFYAFCIFTFFRYCRFYQSQLKNQQRAVSHLYLNLAKTPLTFFYLQRFENHYSNLAQCSAVKPFNYVSIFMTKVSYLSNYSVARKMKKLTRMPLFISICFLVSSSLVLSNCPVMKIGS